VAADALAARGAGGAVGLERAVPGAARPLARERGEAVGVAAARRPAGGSAAHVRRAVDRDGLAAGAAAVAARLRPGRRARAGGGRADRRGGLLRAGAGAVARARVPAGHRRARRAHPVRVGGARRYVRARPQAARHVARLAHRARRRPAADAVDAGEAGQAVHGGGARSALRHLVAAEARPRIADGGRDAVRVAPAGGVARRRGGVAQVGRAGDRGGRPAGARAVAGARVRLRRRPGRTGRPRAGRPGRVALAGAVAVADAVGAARGGPHVPADPGRIAPAGRDVRAGPGGAGGRIARLAGAVALGRAADAVPAEAGLALGPVGADDARVLQTARCVRADGGRGALRVRGAGREAGARAAEEGRAAPRRRLHAGAVAVAGGRRREGRGADGAGRRRAGRAARVPLAGARLALAVGPTARRPLVPAHPRRVDGSGRDVGADAERSGERARLAGAGARLVAAVALGAEPAPALAVRGARRAVVGRAARARLAPIRGHTLRVGGTGVEALAAIAGEGGAGPRRRRDAAAGAVARRGRGVDVRGAGLRGAGGRVRVELAAARAVALAILAAARRARVLAHGAGVGVPGPHHRALAARRRQRAAPAGARAGAVAADAVHALARLALAGLAAALAVLLGPAGVVHAGDALVAIVVGVADDGAGVGRAKEGGAVQEPRRPAGPQAVAGRGGVQPVSRAGRRRALGVDGIPGAAADAVALAVGAAAGGALVLADAVRIREAGFDRPARAFARGQRARDTRPLASDAAADLVGAEPRQAGRVGGARAAVLQFPAAAGRVTRLPVGALAGRVALLVTVAGRRVAGEGRADHRGARAAVPGSVTDLRPLDRRPLARPALAQRAEHVLATGTGAVALAVQPAAADGRGGTVRRGARVRAGGAGDARPLRSGQGAGPTAAAAGFVAAEPVDAEVAGAVGRAAARLAVRHPGAAVPLHAHAALAGRVVGGVVSHRGVIRHGAVAPGEQGGVSSRVRFRARPAAADGRKRGDQRDREPAGDAAVAVSTGYPKARCCQAEVGPPRSRD